MMKAIHDLGLPHRSSFFGRVTVSMGIASRQTQSSVHIDSLIHSADTALYNAKISGRNRISWCCPADVMEQVPDVDVSPILHHKSICLECFSGSEMESRVGVP
jgi:predicted signal transduction protein with EAL and GGDEF domain